ncbi:MAG: MBL fold metallo-hydrolase [Thermodesulfobacteriota bacterium]|nr:MBL fold metallo-hydrolase [Thermodesulfobacteriota bacterium]
MQPDHIFPVLPDLYLIELAPPVKGFDNFIGVWAHTARPRFIVDTGPSVTAKALLTALAKINMEAPDYVLLTHIHMDHAGAAGEIARTFPDAAIVCHENAIPHLVNPEKLQAGTVKTLGDIGRAYGPMLSVPEERIVNVAGLNLSGLTALMTPGHAPHHVSFLTSDSILFAGEACGVNIQFSGDSIYMRPATPPRFRLETTMASIDKLIQAQPDIICFGHFGMQLHAVTLLKQHRDQLLFWKDMVVDELAAGNDKNLTERCVNRLLTEDPLLRGLNQAEASIRERERFFIHNSIQGIARYIVSDDH